MAALFIPSNRRSFAHSLASRRSPHFVTLICDDDDGDGPLKQCGLGPKPSEWEPPTGRAIIGSLAGADSLAAPAERLTRFLLAELTKPTMSRRRRRRAALSHQARAVCGLDVKWANKMAERGQARWLGVVYLPPWPGPSSSSHLSALICSLAVYLVYLGV